MDAAPHRIVTAEGLALAVETFGPADGVPLLLIMGAMNPGLLWYDPFCTALATRGLRVIRYDHRDTGQSATVPYAARPYDLDDLTRDAVAVLDGLGVEAAHVVGLSMGGYIGQLMALDHAPRVRSLTLIASTADHRPFIAATHGGSSAAYELPPPAPVYLDLVRAFAARPPRTPVMLLDTLVESWRAVVGPQAPFDEAAWRQLMTRVLQRARDPMAAFNHAAATAVAPPRTHRLKDIACPTLVIHGGRDVCLPVAHGRALAEAIPGARLVVIEDMGHMFPPEWSEDMAARIADHVASSV